MDEKEQKIVKEAKKVRNLTTFPFKRTIVSTNNEPSPSQQINQSVSEVNNRAHTSIKKTMYFVTMTKGVEMFTEKLYSAESPIELYGICPPKKGTETAKVEELALKLINRITPLNLDGLILYDIFDEASRTSEERPFPFIETLDPFSYASTELDKLPLPKIIYRATSKYSPKDLTSLLRLSEKHLFSNVFVGAASGKQPVNLTLTDSYALYKELQINTPLGGVMIPERHAKAGDEHHRVFRKIDSGCQFFISQGVYNAEASKNFLSDYYFTAKKENRSLVPIIFTFTPCGSLKTLEFMKWLGISLPHWLENELIHSSDILETSIDICEQIWKELLYFAREKQIPIGFNVESVAIRKVEIEASLELVKRLQHCNRALSL